MPHPLSALLVLVIVLATPAMGRQPAADEAPRDTFRLIVAGDGVELERASIPQPYVAVHFVSPSLEPSIGGLVEEFQRRGPELAGVRHLVVHPGAIEPAREFAATLADPGWVCVDPGGAARGVLKAEGAATITIVLDRAGAEIARVESAEGTLPRFDDFKSALSRGWRSPAIAQYNLPKNSTLAVEGYDVVSYLDARAAAKGQERFTSDYRGVTYRFANAGNLRTFAKDPERYLPTYGGWCASAMGDTGAKVEIDPGNFKVKDGRLFLFYKGVFSDALKDWNKREKEWEPAADRNWKKLTGEDAIRPGSKPGTP